MGQPRPLFVNFRSLQKLMLQKKGKTRSIFVYFRPFDNGYKYGSTLTIKEKIIDGVLGIQIQGGMMVGTDESTELWRHPH